ncbi:MAG: ASCH domain-containing protein [Acidimicrobiales bacterium]
MKALSLHQPWASLIAIGVKKVETRHWTTSYRGPLAIHAAATTSGLDGLKVARYGWVGAYCTGRVSDEVSHVAGCDCDEDEETVGERCMSNSTHEHALLREEGAYGFSVAAKLPLGAVVATCDLVDVVPIADVDFAPRLPHVQPSRHADTLLLCRPTTSYYGGGGVSGTFDSWESEDITDQRAYGDFTPGRFAWLLENIVALPEPVPAKGRQGVWEWVRT